MASALIALTTASCTTTIHETKVVPMQPVIINRYFLVPVPVEPEQNCGGVPNCWYEEDEDLGEA